MREGPIHCQVRDGLGISTRTHIAKAMYTEKRQFLRIKVGMALKARLCRVKQLQEGKVVSRLLLLIRSYIVQLVTPI